MASAAIRVSAHAVERYRERVRDVPAETIHAVLAGPAVRAAVAFGARYVKLGTGHRVVLDGATVVTVLPARSQDWRMDPRLERPHP